MLSSLCQYRSRKIFFPNVPLADKFNLDASLSRHLFGIFPNPVAERLGELRVVEDPDVPLVQKRRHPAGEADPRQRAEYQHPVKTTQYTLDLRRVPLRQ
jgi:hypothetical protein